MNIDDVAIQVAEGLNAAAVPYMLVGGFSSNYHGIPRSTKDADFVVELDRPLGAGLANILGPGFEPEMQMTFETNTGTQRQEFRMRDTLFKVEIFKLSNDPHDRERFRRRQPADLEGHRIFFPTAEDVIIWKLRWRRSKDKEDVRAVMGVQRGKLDWPYIESWCDKHGTRQFLEEIRRTVPDV